MKLLSACILFVVVCAQAVLAQEAFKAPQLVVNNPVFDFGTIKEGEKISYDFVLENTGTLPLHLISINPACGCTAVAATQNEIPAGKSTTLTVTFDSQGFSGNTVKTVRITTDDPSKPSTVLTMQGVVIREIELSPSRVSFGEIRRGQSRSIDVEVKMGANDELKEVTTKSEFLKVERVKNAKRKFTVTLLAQHVPLGIFREQVTVQTTNPRFPLLALPVFAKIEGDVRITPSDVSFGLLEGPLKSEINQSVRLESQGDPFEILSLKMQSNVIEATFKRISEKSFLLNVSLKTSAQGTIKSSIEIQTSLKDPEQRTITLPVYAIVTSKGE